jgi:hypothetical protein
MNHNRRKFALLAVCFIGVAIAMYTWATSHRAGPDILPADAALYTWGYYPLSELTWANRDSSESVALVPLEIDALKAISDDEVSQVDVRGHLFAITDDTKIILIDTRSWEVSNTFDTGLSLWRIKLAPSLNQIAFVVCPPHANTDCWLGVLEVASGYIRKTAAKDISATSTLSWHPDSNSLLYISTSGRIISYSVSDLQAREIGKGTFAAYSPDGLRLAYEAEYRIVIRDMRTGRERSFNAEWWDLPRWRFALEPPYYSLHWHKAGRFLAFTADVMKILPDDLVTPFVYSCNVLDVETGDYVTLYEERGGTCGPWLYR